MDWGWSTDFGENTDLMGEHSGDAIYRLPMQAQRSKCFEGRDLGKSFQKDELLCSIWTRE